MLINYVLIKIKKYIEQVRSNKDASKGRMFKEIVLNCFKFVFKSKFQSDSMISMPFPLKFRNLKKKKRITD